MKQRKQIILERWPNNSKRRSALYCGMSPTVVRCLWLLGKWLTCLENRSDKSTLILWLSSKEDLKNTRDIKLLPSASFANTANLTYEFQLLIQLSNPWDVYFSTFRSQEELQINGALASSCGNIATQLQTQHSWTWKRKIKKRHFVKFKHVLLMLLKSR